MTNEAYSNVLPQGTKIGRTALQVSDLRRLTDFYRNVVGLTVQHQSSTTVVLGVDETPLLVLEDADDILPQHKPSAGLYHNAFRVPSREALGDALLRVQEHWQLDGASNHRVSEAIYLTDPEGNGIEIYRDFPRDKWPIAEDGTVQTSTEPIDLGPIQSSAQGALRVPPETDIGHIHLEVSSLDDFSDFYVDTLGFKVQTAASGAYFLSAGEYHHHLGANTWHHRSEPVDGRGLSWFEVVLPETQVLDELQDRLAESQYTETETDDGFSVTDSDGIEIRFRVEA